MGSDATRGARLEQSRGLKHFSSSGEGRAAHHRRTPHAREWPHRRAVVHASLPTTKAHLPCISPRLDRTRRQNPREANMASNCSRATETISSRFPQGATTIGCISCRARTVDQWPHLAAADRIYPQDTTFKFKSARRFPLASPTRG